MTEEEFKNISMEEKVEKKIKSKSKEYVKDYNKEYYMKKKEKKDKIMCPICNKIVYNEYLQIHQKKKICKAKEMKYDKVIDVEDIDVKKLITDVKKIMNDISIYCIKSSKRGV